ncbi:phosphotransferase [Actinokineospora sp.]|uniref:phosphotransferase n=1 Tax=Actinokineospora sp. TaxID=1872133 RepID=UPI003D6C1017
MTIVDEVLHTHSRRASAGELAEIYAGLAETDPLFDTAVPAVLFGGVLPAPEQAERLRRFGFTVLERDCPCGVGALVLGGTLHGTWFPLTADPSAHVAAVVADAERARLREWAGDMSRPEFTTMHKPGSDSLGVVQFRVAGAEIVAKIGGATAIAGEVAFAREVNSLLAKEGRRALFPRVEGVRWEGAQAVSLMEAGTPMPLSLLFTDSARTTLDPAALDLLEPHLDQVSAWYRLTARRRRPTVVDYLYRERYHILCGQADFLTTFEALFPETPLADMLEAAIVLPDGTRMDGYRTAVSWLDQAVRELLPEHGSAVHGDIYAANMLVRADGSPVLIDPRTIWEGRNRPDVGYGDPVFDFATLLHGVFPMAAILRSAEQGVTAGLVDGGARPVDGVLDLTSLRLPLRLPDSVEALIARMLRGLPHDEPSPRVTARLYIGAATSLAGWLKYRRSLKTPQAWLSTFAYVCWYLRQARAVWEDGVSNGKKDS